MNNNSSELLKVLKQNAREYGMYFALFIIFLIFSIMSKGLFISPRNISDLLNQTGYIAVLAVGMTLVIVIRHIDLSVGFLAGFLGAIAAIALQMWKWNVFVAILFVLILGIITGIATAFLVAKLGIPSFVATLAGWLIYRGALVLVTLKTGTIIVSDSIFNSLGNGYIPDIFTKESNFLPGVHKITLILGILTIILFVTNKIITRKNKQKYNFEVLPRFIFILQIIFMIILMSYITWILAGYNGLSWTFVIMLGIVFIFDFIATQTVLGRHIYAVGGNPEAAELSGISVKTITYIVFAIMGFLTAISGILFTSRLRSATPQAGTLFELDCIAAAYIGGVSAAGGVGKITGSLIGALVYMSLTSGMNLLGTDISLQYIIRGAVLAMAVIFDVTTRKVKK